MNSANATDTNNTVISFGNIDFLNVSRIPLSGKQIICREIEISGWIIDPTARRVFSRVAILVGDIEFNAEYGLSRQDIALHFNNPDYYHCGFRLKKIIEGIEEGEYEVTVRAFSGKSNEYHELIYPEKVVFRNKGMVARWIYYKREICRTTRNKMIFCRGFIRAPGIVLSFPKNVIALVMVRWFANKEVKLISLVEHIGDIAACEPVPRMLKHADPQAHVVWLTKYAYKSLIDHNPNIDQTLGVTCIFEWSLLKKLKLSFQVIDLHLNQKPCTVFNTALENKTNPDITLENYYFYGNLLEVFLAAAGLPKMDLAPEFHFDRKINIAVPKNLVVLHTVSNELSRNWQSEKWNDLVRRFIARGYFVAEVGNNGCIDLDHNRFLNYCGKLSLQEIAVLIKGADLFIGVDSAFAHFANAVNTPGVILLGYYRAFKKYMPYSGQYKSGENATVIQYEGYAKDIPVESVYTAAMKKLQARRHQ